MSAWAWLGIGLLFVALVAWSMEGMELKYFSRYYCYRIRFWDRFQITKRFR